MDNLLWVIWHTVCAAESAEGRERGERAQPHMNTQTRQSLKSKHSDGGTVGNMLCVDHNELIMI